MTLGTNPETLYEGQLPITTPVLAYTAPPGREVTVTSVSLVNITGTAATARIDRMPSGGTDGTTEEVFNGSVGANATVALPLTGPGPVATLNPGDALYVM